MSFHPRVVALALLALALGAVTFLLTRNVDAGWGVALAACLGLAWWAVRAADRRDLVQVDAHPPMTVALPPGGPVDAELERARRTSGSPALRLCRQTATTRPRSPSPCRPARGSG